MRKISGIAKVALLIMVATVQTAIAAQESINLCEQTINVGGAWGVCNPSDTAYAQGNFQYNTVGVKMIFAASAHGLAGSDGTMYSLIYYRDTDPLHVADSGLPVNLLDESPSTSGSATFGGEWVGGNIPASDDVNSITLGGSGRGKIWIVPKSEIKTDGSGKLTWTGYGNGNVMQDYLFASDIVTTIVPATVKDTMGGITYTYTPPGQLLGTGQVGACPIGVTGIELPQASLEYGLVYPGATSEDQTINVDVSASGFVGDGINTCEVSPETVEATVDASEWSSIAGNTMPKDSTSVTINTEAYIFGEPVSFNVGVDSNELIFTLTTPGDAIPDTYTQTITVTQIS